MSKTLFVHQHTEAVNGHISTLGRALVNNYDIYYRSQPPVRYVFYSSLLWTTETAVALMTGRVAFNEAVIHGPIDGLGDKYSLQLLGQSSFDDLANGDLSRLLSDLREDHREEVVRTFCIGAVEAVRNMFAIMEDGQLGVGVFHDPFISLAALAFGLEDARELVPMEYVVFTMDDNGDIVATWPQVG